jgi:hypothetical protein
MSLVKTDKWPSTLRPKLKPYLDKKKIQFVIHNRVVVHIKL